MDQMQVINQRLLPLIALLLVGFGLRLHHLTVPDLNIDETWSYIHSYFLAFSSDYDWTRILAPEPNNALHLLLTSLSLRFLPLEFGARWVSVAAGVLTLALSARIGYRLYGKRGAFCMALLMAFGYAPIAFSQIARPYALATLFAAASVLFWLEKRPRLNMITSILLILSHVGALPALLLQDIGTVVGILRGYAVNKTDWIVRRIPVYALFFTLVYMQAIRRDIHVISSGTPPPGLSDILYHVLNTLYNGLPGWTVGSILFAFGVIVPVGLIALARRRDLRYLDIALLWIGLSYLMLAAAALLSDGAIRFSHLSHVAIPLALLITGVVVTASRTVRMAVLAAFVAASVFGLAGYYREPYRYLSDTRVVIDGLRLNDEPVYIAQPTILWEFQVNNPDAAHIQPLPASEQRGAAYLYLEQSGWQPEAPPECNPAPLWSDASGLQLLTCNH